MRKIHLTGERNFKIALEAAVDTYNKTPHSTTKVVPDRASEPQNQATVISNIEKGRNRFLDKHYEKYHKLNEKFSVGDVVRRKIPQSSFTKESENLFSDQLYCIDKIVPTGPLHGYRIQDLHNGVLMPGSYTPDQLLK